MSESVLKRCRPASGVRATGDTRFVVDGVERTAFAELRIVTVDGCIYLSMCDENGTEVTDTFHESIGDAMDQAEFSFGVTDGDWTDG